MEKLSEVKDPVQKQIREKKKEWNQKISAFIDDLIEFKKLMNGTPSSYDPKKGKITSEINANPVALLKGLVSTFAALASEGNKIADEQKSYALERVKNKKSPSKAASDLFGLNTTPFIVQGSNRFSRFFSAISPFKGPFFGRSFEARQRRYRLNLLKNLTDAKELSKIVYKTILKKDKLSIKDSFKAFEKLQKQIAVTHSVLRTYLDSIREEISNLDTAEIPSDINVPSVPDAPTSSLPPIPVVKEEVITPSVVQPAAKKVTDSAEPKTEAPSSTDQSTSEPNEDVKVKNKNPQSEVHHSVSEEDQHKAARYSEDLSNLSNFDFLKIIQEYIKIKEDLNDGEKQTYANLMAKFNEHLTVIHHHLGNLSDMTIKSIQAYEYYLELLQTLTNTSMSSFTEIVKAISPTFTAQAGIGDTFRRIRHQLSIWDNTSAMRLDIHEGIRELSKVIDETMNHLEKELDPDQLTEDLARMTKINDNMIKYFVSLNKAIGNDKVNNPLAGLYKNTGIYDESFDLSSDEKDSVKEYRKVQKNRAKV